MVPSDDEALRGVKACGDNERLSVKVCILAAAAVRLDLRKAFTHACEPNLDGLCSVFS
jgi:hypothetical protein